jgi:CRISPR/Cas system CMR-associated protein Cmr5 small subunit
MKNLDQYRVASALQFWQNDATKRLLGRETSSLARQLPLLLATQGLLPLIAFAKSSGTPARGGRPVLILAGNENPARGDQ